MQCIKCGKETADNRIFCEGCLGTMADYPIQADAKVTLPHREEAVTPKKQPRKRTVEELLESSRRLNRRLITALVAVSVLFALSVTALIYTYDSGDQLPTIGRNYTIDTTRQP